jgi:UDPglucose--hexose-1-phosphate uridylyltransferase
MLQARSRAQAAQGRAHVQLLVNQGRPAGASIAHPHAQLVALDFVPPAVSVAVDRFNDALGDPVVDDQAMAVSHGAAVVTGTEVSAWCPLGSATPFEMRVAALGAGPRFASATDGEVLGVALVLRDVLAALGRTLGDVPYNVVLHDAPTAGAVGDVAYHWWLEVVPRTAVVAGFELGTGVLVNTVDPADAARQLRT